MHAVPFSGRKVKVPNQTGLPRVSNRHCSTLHDVCIAHLRCHVGSGYKHDSGITLSHFTRFDSVPLFEEPQTTAGRPRLSTAWYGRVYRWCFASWRTCSARKSWRNGARTTRRSTCPPTSPSANCCRACSDAPPPKIIKIIEPFPRRRRQNPTTVPGRRTSRPPPATVSGPPPAAVAAARRRQSRAPSCSSPSCCAAQWRPSRRTMRLTRHPPSPPARRQLRVTVLPLADLHRAQRQNLQVVYTLYCRTARMWKWAFWHFHARLFCVYFVYFQFTASVHILNEAVSFWTYVNDSLRCAIVRNSHSLFWTY